MAPNRNTTGSSLIEFDNKYIFKLIILSKRIFYAEQFRMLAWLIQAAAAAAANRCMLFE